VGLKVTSRTEYRSLNRPRAIERTLLRSVSNFTYSLRVRILGVSASNPRRVGYQALVAGNQFLQPGVLRTD
jgi:hypothetical protein